MSQYIQTTQNIIRHLMKVRQHRIQILGYHLFEKKAGNERPGSVGPGHATSWQNAVTEPKLFVLNTRCFTQLIVSGLCTVSVFYRHFDQKI